MYRLGLIVCLVLSDVNVFLKLKRKRGFSDSFDGLISYYVYFASLKNMICYVLRVRVFSLFFLLLYFFLFFVYIVLA